MPSGGKRPGAGRPKTGRLTKVIRVPLDFPDQETIKEIQEVLQEYYDDLKENPKRKELARWKKITELLNKVKEISPTFLK